MSGEVTNNAYTQYSTLMNNLNAQWKSGKITKQEAEAQLLAFRTEHKAELYASQPATEAAAAQEADSAMASAFGASFGHTAAAEAQSRAGANTATPAAAGEPADGQPVADNGKKNGDYTPMQELLLKQGQAKYPDNKVILDEKGKIVVLDKKTGKIDEEKTKDAAKIQVQGSTSQVTVKEDDANPDVKLRVPDKQSVEDMQQYNKKDKAHNEFTTGSKAEYEKAKQERKDYKKEYKAKDKEVRQLEKQYYKANSSERAALREKLDKARAERDELLKKKEDAQNEYTKQKALYKTGGERGIARAARKNEKNYGNVDDLHQVFTNKDEEKEYLAAHPDEKGHTTTLSRKQFNTLDNIRSEAQRYLDERQKALESATDEASKKKAQKELDDAKVLYGDLAECIDPKTGKIDAKKLQSGIMQFTGADARANIDEKTQMSKEFNVSRTKITSLVRELGFGNESRTARRFGAAGAAAAATAVASLIGKKSQHAHAEDHAYDFKEGETVTTTATDIKTATLNYVDQYGDYNTKKLIAEANATATAKGGSAEAWADAVVDVVAKTPLFGQIAAPVIAGISTFLLCNPQSKDAFNGNSVDHVLSHLDDVSGKDNKKIVAQIQDMELTGDPVRDKAIKAAVIQASIGPGSAKANTEELLAAYQNLKDTKEAIGKLQVLPEPTVDTQPPTPPKPPTPPTPPAPKQPRVVGGWARDHKLLDKHNIPMDQRNVNGTGKDRAQIVIADEDGEISVTGDNMKEPDTITIKDNTNTKVNTFQYRKLTEDEIKKGQTKDGVKLTGLNGRSGPFYVLVSATDDKGSLKNNHTEVYQLELQVESDKENGDAYRYNLEQYEGMNGSGQSSMKWPWRAKR